MDARPPAWRRWQLPTWAVAVAVYGAWLLLTAAYHSLPLWAVGVLGGWLVAWHGSLQHETIHGHPTRSGRINAAVGGIPLGVWLPYGIYRSTHLAHHRSETLTDPDIDPESFYLSPRQWRRLPRPARWVAWAHNTLLGRLILGPPLAIGRFLASEARRLLAGDRSHLGAWSIHLIGLAAVSAWVIGVCDIPIGSYLLLFVYPGLALTLLRSFAEHRADSDRARRTAIVESGPIMGLLYLNNNLHAVHHARPGLPWYEVPVRYRADREQILGSGGDYYSGYLTLLSRYAVRAREAPVHPEADDGRDPPAR